MRIYLAARYTRRDELNVYAEELRNNGYIVDARWLCEDQQGEGVRAVERAEDDMPDEAAIFALDDIIDINNADAIICFTEKPREAFTRGGRHFEAGYAVASNKKTIVVGPREHVFYCLPSIVRFNTWEECKGALAFGLLEQPHPAWPEPNTPRFPAPVDPPWTPPHLPYETLRGIEFKTRTTDNTREE